MSLKRLASDRPHEEAGDDDREVKKQKTLPHWGKRKQVIEDFLDVLSSACESVTEFNVREKEEGQYGVHQICMDRIHTGLDELKAASDEKTLDVKLHDIESYLADRQAVYADYIDDMAVEGEKVQRRVKTDLGDVIWKIKKARGQLLGTFYYWMNRRGEAECYYPRPQSYFTEQTAAIGLRKGEELGGSTRLPKSDALYAPGQVPWPTDLPAPFCFRYISLAQQGTAPCN
jgi:hypothetical protein